MPSASNSRWMPPWSRMHRSCWGARAIPAQQAIVSGDCVWNRTVRGLGQSSLSEHWTAGWRRAACASTSGEACIDSARLRAGREAVGSAVGAMPSQEPHLRLLRLEVVARHMADALGADGARQVHLAIVRRWGWVIRVATIQPAEECNTTSASPRVASYRAKALAEVRVLGLGAPLGICMSGGGSRAAACGSSTLSTDGGAFLRLWRWRQLLLGLRFVAPLFGATNRDANSIECWPARIPGLGEPQPASCGAPKPQARAPEPSLSSSCKVITCEVQWRNSESDRAGGRQAGESMMVLSCAGS